MRACYVTPNDTIFANHGMTFALFDLQAESK